MNFAYEFPDRKQIQRRPATIWRYREALPVRDDHSIVSFQEGFSPLVADSLDSPDVESIKIRGRGQEATLGQHGQSSHEGRPEIGIGVDFAGRNLSKSRVP